MTFWEDARPATPRFRLPARPEPSPRRHRRRRRRVLVILAVLVASVGISAVRAGGEVETTAKAQANAKAVSARTRATGAARPRVVPARWARSLPDWASIMVVDDSDPVPGVAMVIGDRWVSSVALADGALRWKTPLADVEPHAVLRGSTLLVTTTAGFAALDRDSGTVQWRTGTTEDAGPVTLVGPVGTPQVAVVSTDQGGLAGLDVRSGRPRWSVRLSGRVRGAFAVDHTSGTVTAVWQSGATAVLRVVDGATGTVRWERPVPPMSSSPVVARDLVAVGAGDWLIDSEVRAFSLADGTARWRSPVDAPFQEGLTPLVDDGDLVVVDQLGTVTRLGLADGTRHWATHTAALEVHGRPIRVDDAILVSNEAGEVVTLDRATGAIRARRRPAGLPVGLVATRRLVIVAQRLVSRDAIQAFDAANVVAPARSVR